MNLIFNDRTITGLLLVVPENERSFLDDMESFNFSRARSLKLKEAMGYDTHRIVEDGVCVSDMVVFGFEYLFDNALLKKDELDAMVLITASPDNFLPPTSSIIHGRLGLKKDFIAVDISQGCAGFLVGLMEGFSLLNQPSIKKVALVTGDVLSRKVSCKDRNSYPLIGDAVSISIIEKSALNTIYANIKMDGTRNDALIIPAGGFRLPSCAQTSVMETDCDGNARCKDNLVMDGTAVFNFVMEEVPGMIDALLEFAGANKEEIDYYLFHQPNKFMLEKLSNAMGVPIEKMPNNVVGRYGNSSSSTIPAAIALNIDEINKRYEDKTNKKSIKICFAGFGVGLTWASMLMDCEAFNFCRTAEYE